MELGRDHIKSIMKWGCKGPAAWNKVGTEKRVRTVSARNHVVDS